MSSKNICKSIIAFMFAAISLSLLVQISPERVVGAKTAGAEVYSQNCVTCHGDDGKANTPRGRRKGATDLTKSSIGNAQGIKVITNGRGEMPAFKNQLSAEDIKNVMAYIRGFRQ